MSNSGIITLNDSSIINIANNSSINTTENNVINEYTGYIGIIISSTLTESQMNNYDSSFYYCDGRSCSGTTYETITSNSTVPDLRGRFLRGLDTSGTVDPDGGSRTLLDEQDYKTALPTIDFTTNTTGAHTHNWGIDTNELSSGGKARSISYSSGGITSSSAGNHSHNVNGGGDNETSPINTSVNFFIKVN